ncbi:MAG: biopolymer transporter ExbD [Proteobacteria bacterium]|jgi:biopolymer transport protein ExbD|nr:biopolymer transporter ExbD [Pseudomonadota bacterium]
MKLSPRRREDPELNLTSLIDVVLLLVIFFMISTTFVQEGRLRVDLPTASNEPVTRVQDPIVVTVTAQGSYRVNDSALVNNARETLAAALRKVAGGREGVPLTIRADARASHQSVVTAMDVAARLGFAQVNIATVSEQT